MVNNSSCHHSHNIFSLFRLAVHVPDEHISFWLKEVWTSWIVPPFAQIVNKTCYCYADIFFFQEASLGCPLVEPFNSCLISPEEPEQSLCGSWDNSSGTLLPQAAAFCVHLDSWKPCHCCFTLWTREDVNDKRSFCRWVRSYCQEGGVMHCWVPDLGHTWTLTCCIFRAWDLFRSLQLHQLVSNQSINYMEAD